MWGSRTEDQKIAKKLKKMSRMKTLDKLVPALRSLLSDIDWRSLNIETKKDAWALCKDLLARRDWSVDDMKGPNGFIPFLSEIRDLLSVDDELDRKDRFAKGGVLNELFKMQKKSEGFSITIRGHVLSCVEKLLDTGCVVRPNHEKELRATIESETIGSSIRIRSVELLKKISEINSQTSYVVQQNSQLLRKQERLAQEKETAEDKKALDDIRDILLDIQKPIDCKSSFVEWAIKMLKDQQYFHQHSRIVSVLKEFVSSEQMVQVEGVSSGAIVEMGQKIRASLAYIALGKYGESLSRTDIPKDQIRAIEQKALDGLLMDENTLVDDKKKVVDEVSRMLRDEHYLQRHLDMVIVLKTLLFSGQLGADIRCKGKEIQAFSSVDVMRDRVETTLDYIASGKYRMNFLDKSPPDFIKILENISSETLNRARLEDILFKPKEGKGFDKYSSRPL